MFLLPSFKAGRVLLFGLLFLTLAFARAPREDPRAREIVDRVDRLLRGNSSVGTVEMEISTQNWRRSLSLRIWSLETERVLIRIDQPKREAGTTTLKVGNKIWNYLPKVNRTIKIPTSMMMASWMGSHFTNDGLVKESRLIRDYWIALSFEGRRNGIEVYEFTLTPRPEAAVVWGKIVLEVRKKDLMPAWQRYYDEEGHLVCELTFSQYRTMGCRLVPTRLVMHPLDKPGEQTVIVHKDIVFDVPLDERVFSLRSLER